MDNNESQVRTVSEIFGCTHDEAKEMLVKCEWDINRVLDNDFATESGTWMDIESSSTSWDDLASGDVTRSGGGISSVLKRKINAEEADVVVINENEKKVMEEEAADAEEAFLGPTTEPCPVCSAPNYLPDKGLARYTCVECGADACRLCYLKAHGEGQECVMEGYKKVTVLPTRNFDAENDLDREFRIAEGQFLRMMSKKKNYEIKSIEIVTNEKLEKKFNSKKQEFKELGIDDKPMLIFHGTPVKNIEAILRHNFDLNKVSNGRKFGDGVYFSEKPEVSVRYTNDWKAMSSLILCLVLKGTNSKEVTNSGNSVNTEETGKPAWAIIVPDVDQILPKYVINFKEVMRRSDVWSSSNARVGGLPGMGGHGHVNYINLPPLAPPVLGRSAIAAPNYINFSPLAPPVLGSSDTAGHSAGTAPYSGSRLHHQHNQIVPPPPLPTLLPSPGLVQPSPSTAQTADLPHLTQQFPTLMEDLQKLQKMLQSPVFQQAMKMTLSSQDPQASTVPSLQKEEVKTTAVEMVVEVEELNKAGAEIIAEDLGTRAVGVEDKKASKEDMEVTNDATVPAGVMSGSDIDTGMVDAASRNIFKMEDDTGVACTEEVRREDDIRGGAALGNDDGSANIGADAGQEGRDKLEL